MACTGEKASTPDKVCLDGYWCAAGSQVDDQYQATPGHYTDDFTDDGSGAGTLDLIYNIREKKCLAGEWNYKYHQASCDPCMAGFYCQYEGTK